MASFWSALASSEPGQRCRSGLAGFGVRRFGVVGLELVLVWLAIAVTLPVAANDTLSNDGVLDEAVSEEAVPYGDWAWTLERFVDEEGHVDYAGLARERERLDRFVRSIAEVSPRSHPERFADPEAALGFYIDAYNALVFSSVLDLGPDVNTVWGKSGTGYGFFVRRKVTVGGRKLSLKKLEDDEIRHAFEDPRIHAALNCASIGCPRLPRMPFAGHPLDPVLDEVMRAFVADPRHCTVDDGARTATVSRIFDWFTKDFLSFERRQGNDDPRLLDYINRYRSPDAQIPRDYKVRFAQYNKRLNRSS